MATQFVLYSTLDLQLIFDRRDTLVVTGTNLDQNMSSTLGNEWSLASPTAHAVSIKVSTINAPRDLKLALTRENETQRITGSSASWDLSFAVPLEGMKFSVTYRSEALGLSRTIEVRVDRVDIGKYPKPILGKPIPPPTGGPHPSYPGPDQLKLPPLLAHLREDLLRHPHVLEEIERLTEMYSRDPDAAIDRLSAVMHHLVDQSLRTLRRVDLADAARPDRDVRAPD